MVVICTVDFQAVTGLSRNDHNKTVTRRQADHPHNKFPTSFSDRVTSSGVVFFVLNFILTACGGLRGRQRALARKTVSILGPV
ncbi:hypothetical protein K504DRAFT_154684 [Pleomassaria siparia CBS 279.74]|uniref:Uncharacterized protein n=1 Tax=Pleomassaria siparia CBS 279.74 TaxID=1314801 RepID=A0A6G1KMN5_9PLEO|nr:hypothetical protein K504DRAFT_154684 [Pleomassaria siparia CBS 279.74]